MNLRSVLPGGHGRRLRVRRGAATVVAVGLAMLGGIAVTATSASATGDKVFVCKYVGTPGDTERLQAGQNPIDVSVSSIKVDPVVVGSYFADAQGRSYVLAFDIGQTEPSVNKCPNSEGPRGVQLPTLTATRYCDRIGTVNATNTDYYTWAASGESDATYYTATKIGDVVLVGTNPQGPFNLAQLGTTQSTNPNGACYVPPRIVTTSNPGISLEKVAVLGDTNNDGLANPGESITYTFSVKNTGDVALSDVTVIDALAGVGPVTCDATALAVGATMSCAAAAFPVTTENATGADIVNVATASGRPPTGSRVEATDTVSTPTGGAVEEVVTVRPAEVPTQVVKGAVVTNAPVVAPAQVESLAFTGAETVPLGLSGLLALLLGAGLVATTRRQGRRANN